LKAWLRYLEAKTQARPVQRYLIYERALKFLPGSYKLWHAYLQERRSAVEGKVPVTHARYQILVNTYERCVRDVCLLSAWIRGKGGEGKGEEVSFGVSSVCVVSDSQSIRFYRSKPTNAVRSDHQLP
jgi:hypothetical protein